MTLTVRLYMRRPNSDFQGGHRLTGMLKSMVAFVCPIRPDIDNLTKFVLDGLNGLVHHDDRQVMKLVVYKLMDMGGDCGGQTVVEVAKYNNIVDKTYELSN